MFIRCLVGAAIVVFAWSTLFVRPAAAQAANTCAALDPTNGGAPTIGATFVTLDLQPGDTVTMTGVNVLLVVLTPAEIAAGLALPGSIPGSLALEAPEATNTFVAATAGVHHLGALENGGISLLESDFSCAVPAPPPAPTTTPTTTTPDTAEMEQQRIAEDMRSQQVSGSSIISRETGRSIRTGISIALSERFADETITPPPVVVKAYSVSGYSSLRGIAAVHDGNERGLSARSGASAKSAADIDTAASGLDAAAYAFALPPMDGPAFGSMTAYRFNAWSHGNFSYVDGGTTEGHTWSGIVGVDYLVTDRLLVGVIGGYESGRFEFGPSNGIFDGEGMTAGAYLGFQMSEQLMLETYVTHTWLDYQNALGTVTGSTDGSRLLFGVSLNGSHKITNVLILEPNISIVYGRETQAAYALSNGATIARNTIEGGRVSAGPKLRYLVDWGGADWGFYASAHGEYDFSSASVSNTALPDFNGHLSARVSLGFDTLFANGWSAGLSGDVGGLGAGQFTSYAVRGKIRIPIY